MAYRLTGTDPFIRFATTAAIRTGARNAPRSFAALLKRRSTGTWNGIHVYDNGSTGNEFYPAEFNPGNQTIQAINAAEGGRVSTQTFNDTANWLIVGWTWDGTATAGHFIFRYKIGSGAWGSDAVTGLTDGAFPDMAAGARHIVGNEAGLGDDADFDITCVGEITSDLGAGLQSLDMASFASWQSVFSGAGAWLVGFDAISSRVDASGNGGDELSRSAGITLQADPPGWVWAAGGKLLVPQPLLMKLSR